MTVVEKYIGSLDLLSQLYKASTLDLVRRFSAKKLQEDKYLLPPDKLPWCTIVDLGQEYPLISGTGTLHVKVRLEPRALSSPVEIGVGFLVQRSDREYVCLGCVVTGRDKVVKCRTRIYSVPYDLWDFPKIVEIPTVVVVGPEVYSNQEEILVGVDLECINMLAPDIIAKLHSVKVRSLYVITDLVSIIGKVKICVDTDTLCYM